MSTSFRSLQLVPTYVHLILTSIFPIFTSAHSSLGRPNNVRPPRWVRRKDRKNKSPDGDDDSESEEDNGSDSEDEDDSSRQFESLTTKDALMFPVIAGLVLGGLYFTIKHLSDPSIITTIMTLYFATVGIFAVQNMVSDCLGVLASIVFPKRWSRDVVISGIGEDGKPLAPVVGENGALLTPVVVKDAPVVADGGSSTPVVREYVDPLTKILEDDKEDSQPIENVRTKRVTYVARYNRWVLRNPEALTEEEAMYVPRYETHPFPHDIIPLPKHLHKHVWHFRRNIYAKWTVLLKFGSLVPLKKSTAHKNFWIGDAVGLLLGILAVILYVVTGKHWFLTNVLGVAFAYGSMQWIAPTNFLTATILLALLFVYDIYFVFFTPLMTTVAMELDVPIKLMFPRIGDNAVRKKTDLAMLGLGDVVLPGVMIAMALRWDYWRWCEARKRAMEKEEKGLVDLSVPEESHKVAEQHPSDNTVLGAGEKETANGTVPEARDMNGIVPEAEIEDTASRGSPTEAVVETPEQEFIDWPEHRLPKYIRATGSWGDRIWWRPSNVPPSCNSSSPVSTSTAAEPRPGVFPKPYFYATLAGYVGGMIMTLVSMHVFKSAQPALLYLVPCVVGALWATAYQRKEVMEMIGYSEEQEEEVEDEVVEIETAVKEHVVEDQGNGMKAVGKEEEGGMGEEEKEAKAAKEEEEEEGFEASNAQEAETELVSMRIVRRALV